MKRPFLAFFAVASCGNPSHGPENAFTNERDGYVVGHPEGWSTSEDRGSTRFTPESGKQTIVVRSAPRPSEIIEGKPTTNEDVASAAALALSRLPGVKLGTARRISDAELSGVRFELTYRPPGSAMRYRRTHVTLVGLQRLYHVIHTVPEAETLDERAFGEMVSTLTEIATEESQP